MGKWDEREKEFQTLKSRVSSLVPSIKLQLRRSGQWCTANDVRSQVAQLKKTKFQLEALKFQMKEKVQEIEKDSTFDSVLGIAVTAIGVGLMGLISNKKKK